MNRFTVWKTLVLSTFFMCLSVSTYTEEFITQEPNTKSYNLVSHYEQLISAKPEIVWPHVMNLKTWMVDFEMSHVSGEIDQVNEVLRLYPEQEFYVQRTAVIPNRLLSIANLPVKYNNEVLTGIGIITLQKLGNKTLVSVTMSRRFTWLGDGDNPMKSKRLSEVNQQRRANTWKSFLLKLQSLAEATSPIKNKE
ncbi:hypothetical protein TDB9533_03429 [Thalassocella blandensis]|nr:hypothetical protein TDB9533_03429 [Thalassocella blandensis]